LRPYTRTSFHHQPEAQHPKSSAIHNNAGRLSHLWKDVPSWFLIAEDDRMIVPATQRFMAERMKAKTKAHAVDHTPSVTAPAVVVDVIRDAIRSVTGN
jgi:pimeloyl-ACP methyl ester carboxylesterase